MMKRGSKYYDSPPSRIPYHIMKQRAKEEVPETKGELEQLREKNVVLEKRVTELQELCKIDQAQAQWIGRVQAEVERLSNMTDQMADAVIATDTLLDEERERNVTLTRLVVRMGECFEAIDSNPYARATVRNCKGYPLTISGQRQHDAAMHEAEGPDPSREDVEL